jgi:tripeptidyl-peptidase-1
MMLPLLFLSQVVLSIATTDTVILESLNKVPEGWKYARPASTHDVLNLRISLKQQNVDSFYDHLLQVSTPNHARYGQHYEGHELRRMLQPSDDTRMLTLDCLETYNITSIEDESDYILFRADVDTVNSLLSTEFAWYASHDQRTERLRTLAYSVSANLKELINFIHPAIHFGSQQKSRRSVRKVKPRSESDELQWQDGKSTASIFRATSP